MGGLAAVGAVGAMSGQGDACNVRCGAMSVCCSEDEECVQGSCEPLCAGSRCGEDDSVCCGTDQLCIGQECVDPGADCVDENDCGEDEICELLVGRCVSIPDDAVCRFRPPVGEFEPVLQWSYEDKHSSALPLIAQLTDDNDDGAIDARDVPDVVAITWDPAPVRDNPSVTPNAGLTALSGSDGRVLWEAGNAGMYDSVAIADLDQDGTVEIVTPGIQCLSHTGEQEWAYAPLGGGSSAVAIADLDADGSPEIIVGGHILSADGDPLWSNGDLHAAYEKAAIHAIADLNGDGTLEIVAGTVAYEHDGTELWRGGSLTNGTTVVAHVIESSPGPQVIVTDATQLEILDGATGRVLFGPVTFGVAAPFMPGLAIAMVANFDDDEQPEIGVSSNTEFAVIDPSSSAPHELWSLSASALGGATVFDFDGDGAVEVVYSDGCHTQILNGADGEMIWNTSLTSTGVTYPVVADVDGDGNSELILSSNELGFANDIPIDCDARELPFTGRTGGIFVYRDRLDHWVPARPIWNQHAYHIDNVGDDGTVPSTEARSWETHNTYRVNRLIDADAITLAPDLVVVSLAVTASGCDQAVELRARVQNRGARGVAAGVSVAFYAGEDPDRSELLAVGLTEEQLLSGQATWVIASGEVQGDVEQMFQFYAVADDDGVNMGSHSECIEDNNAALSVFASCRGPD